MAQPQYHGPTGVPEGGYDGPQAEKMRQERVFALLKERDPELIEMVKADRIAAKKAQDKWAETRLKLAGAVGNDGVHDVLSVIDADISEFEKRLAQQSATEISKNYRAPDYALSEEEQRARRAGKK